MRKSFDTIVIGLGAMGSAAVYQLALRRKNVLGIDQFAPPHALGSSHGDTRIIRQAIGEGAEYVPLVLRSYELWHEIEKAAGTSLLSMTGGLIMTSVEQPAHGTSFFDQTVASARQYDIAHTLLDAGQIQKRFPQFKLQGNETGYFEEQSGFLRPERCLAAQLALAQRHGAELALHERVIRLTASGSNDKVSVTTDKGEYEAETAILSAGPWVASLLDNRLASYFDVYRQVLYWFDVNGPIAQFESPTFPVWIWEFGTGAADSMYGFPAIDGQSGGVKLATAQYSNTTNPDHVAREVTPQETQAMFQRYVQPHFHDLNDRCMKAAVCMYTVTPDHQFVIDTHPESPRIIIASPCSGHGFKHSAAIGEIVAQLASDGQSTIDISKFSLARLMANRA